MVRLAGAPRAFGIHRQPFVPVHGKFRTSRQFPRICANGFWLLTTRGRQPDAVAYRFRISLGLLRRLLQQRRRPGEGGASAASFRVDARACRAPAAPTARARGTTARCDPPGTAVRGGPRLHTAGHPLRFAPAGLGAQNRALQASDQTRPDLQRARRRWQRQQSRWDPARLVFLSGSRAKKT